MAKTNGTGDTGSAWTPFSGVAAQPIYPERVRALFAEISDLANEVAAVLDAQLVLDSRESDLHQRGWLSSAARRLTLHMGWLADMGSQGTGGQLSRGDAHDWLLDHVARQQEGGVRHA